MRRLENKVAVITGGAQGIGKATAEKFANEGASVVIWDMNEEKGVAVVKELKKKNTPAIFQSVNVAKLESVELATKEALAQFGKIDVLVNNAGITKDASFLKMTPEQWQQVIDINLTGVFNCTKAVAPSMVERKYGRIINASSVVGLYGNFGQTNYVATKASVIGMTQVWARELGRKGITVNAVAPGFIATEMIQTIPEKILEAIKEKTPLQRFGAPEDVANVYCFLASDEAAFINGTVISVDGGYIPFFTSLLASTMTAQVINYPVDDERRNGTPEKLPPELQFIGFSFHRFTGTNIAPQNELLRGQIIGRLYGNNSTTTVPQTPMYGESRFVPLFVYRPSILDGKAIFRTLLKVDFTWGDVNYGVGNNFGGAISGGTVNIQTLLANLEIKPVQTWNIVVGLQRIFDNPRDPNINTLQTNQTSASRLMFWGTQGVGVSSYFNLSPTTFGRIGGYQLYENLVDRDDDVALWMLDLETKLSGLWDLGGNFWYVWDRGAGQGGVSVLGQGFNSPLVDYNGGARLQLDNPLYRANVFWTGLNTAYNRDFISGRWWFSAMSMINFGNIDTLSEDQQSAGRRIDIAGFTAHASLQHKYGQTGFDKLQFEALFTTGDRNGGQDGKYSGVVTGNTWGTPVGIFSSHRSFLLFPDVQVINRYYSAVHDISNLGYGVTALFFNYFNAPIPNKLHYKIGSAVAWSNAKPTGGGNFIGTELNAEIKYTYALFFDIGLSAAYLWNGNFYDSNFTRNSPQKPANAWTVFTTVSWLMF